MYVSCNEWHDNHLGGICNQDCDSCFGGKENVFAKDTFEIPGEALCIVRIEKGHRFWIHSESIKRVILKDNASKDHMYVFQKDFFKEHFSYEQVQ